MEENDQLFRHEAGRMVSALTRKFGVYNLPLVEDVVQDAFVARCKCGAFVACRKTRQPG
jgi:predicted RNA polymerase sigma factor